MPLRAHVQFHDPNITVRAKKSFHVLAAQAEGFLRVRFIPVNDCSVFCAAIREVYDHIAHSSFHQHLNLPGIETASRQILQESIGPSLCLLRHAVAEGANSNTVVW